MRVVCIRTGKAETDVTPVVVGNLYTVLEVKDNNDLRPNDSRVSKGKYYKFIEKKGWHHESMFIPINEDQQDETTFERNYQTQTA